MVIYKPYQDRTEPLYRDVSSPFRLSKNLALTGMRIRCMTRQWGISALTSYARHPPTNYYTPLKCTLSARARVLQTRLWMSLWYLQKQNPDSSYLLSFRQWRLVPKVRVEYWSTEPCVLADCCSTLLARPSCLLLRWLTFTWSHRRLWFHPSRHIKIHRVSKKRLGQWR